MYSSAVEVGVADNKQGVVERHQLPQTAIKDPEHQLDHLDEAEKEYLLEYYSLVCEGKTNYVSNSAFQAIFGHRGQELSEFFQAYSGEFKPKKRRVESASKSSGEKAKSRKVSATPMKKTRGSASKMSIDEEAAVDDEEMSDI
ncbi:hypothetical protein C8J57DRAFT_1255524 [Mycena rebaudengoi]|nr:hypothetical protein C8J57DRAFT_1255524 [Mycena rebaudengoi]